MPMMVLNDDNFANEVSKFCSDKIINKEIKEETIGETKPGGKVVDILRGRGASRLEVPNSIRALISEEAINGTSPEILSEQFGISKSSISAYKNDAVSTASYDSPNKELKDSNDLVRENISEIARGKLLRALEHVTDEKMQDAKLRDIASVAASMSGIIKNMEPNGPVTNNHTQVIVYKPRMRDEDEFEVITVNE